MLNGYTFFVDNGISPVQVYPRVSNLRFSVKPDGSNGFYRLALSTPMVFAGSDYTLLKTEDDANDCTVWDFVIKFAGTEVYRGYMRFDTSAFAWDISNCRVSVRIDPQDDYTCFLREWGNQINIFDGTATHDVSAFFGAIECELCVETAPGSPPDYPLSSIPVAECTPALSPSDGWTITYNINEGVTLVSVGPPALYETQIGTQTRYCRQFVSDASHSSEPPGDGWLNVTGGWARAITVTADLANSALTPNASNELIQAFFSPGLNLEDEDNPVISTIDNGVLLNDLLVTFAPCGLDVVSDFFGIDPDATAPANDAYTWASEYAQAIIVWQKSDVKRPGATNNATNGKWTYQGLLNAIAVQYNLRLRITGTTLRIEHVSYFEAANGTDIATDYPDRIRGLHRYQIDDSQTPKSERWQFMENTSAAFAGVPIKYNCFGDENTGEQVYQIERTNNDIPELLNSPDSFADDGFVFGCCHEDSGTYYLISAENPIDSTLYLNGPFSIPNLLDALHRWERPLPEGDLNEVATTFESSRKRKKQTSISIPMGATDFFAFDFSELVNTQIGWGEVTEASYDAASCLLTLNTAHT